MYVYPLIINIFSIKSKSSRIEDISIRVQLITTFLMTLKELIFICVCDISTDTPQKLYHKYTNMNSKEHTIIIIRQTYLSVKIRRYLSSLNASHLSSSYPPIQA